MLALHDGLLDEGLVPLDLQELLLHVIVLSLLFNNARLEVFKVGHHIWVNDLDIFIILRGQMIFHQTDFLSEHLNLFLIFAKGNLGVSNPLFDPLHLSFDILLLRNRNLGAICSESCIIARGGTPIH